MNTRTIPPSPSPGVGYHVLNLIVMLATMMLLLAITTTLGVPFTMGQAAFGAGAAVLITWAWRRGQRSGGAARERKN